MIRRSGLASFTGLAWLGLGLIVTAAGCSESSAPATTPGTAGNMGMAGQTTAGQGGSGGGSVTAGTGGTGGTDMPMAGTGGTPATGGSAGDGAGGLGGMGALGGSGGGGGGAGRDPSDMSMSFFITSYGVAAEGAEITEGEMVEGVGDMGGLAGADAHCQTLATAVNDGGNTWRAYLSTSMEDARNRIGPGPWYNAAGTLVAMNIEDLHTEDDMPGRSGDAAVFGINEMGEQYANPEHDVVTGSNEDGTVAEGMTCQDWTSASADDMTVVGHLDGMGGNRPGVNGWNSEHPVQGCDADNISTPGRGLFYCFAL